MNGYGLLFVPFSWALGRWNVYSKPPTRVKKTLWALGPFRFVRHYDLGAWLEWK